MQTIPVRNKNCEEGKTTKTHNNKIRKLTEPGNQREKTRGQN